MELSDSWNSLMGFVDDVISNPFENITALSMSKWVFYCVLLLHIAHYQQFLPSNLRSDHLMRKGFKYVSWCHGIGVFITLQWFHNESTAIASLTPTHYIILSALVVVLWDLGVVHSTALKLLIPLNLHHVAVFIALVYQPGETAAGAWRNMTFFSWIWLIHSFSILNEIILPLLGIHLAEGERVGALEAIRHVYAVGTVYFFHLYISGEGQPGLGWNYQTTAVVCMMMGRFIAGDNYKNVPFIRRVEVPGCLLVLLSYYAFPLDHYFERSFGVMSSFFVCYLTYKVFFTVTICKPTQYRGPFCEEGESDPDVLKFIETFRSAVEVEFPGDTLDINEDDTGFGFYTTPEFLGPWFDSQQKGAWIEKYKLFRAVACADKAEVTKLLADETDWEGKTRYQYVNRIMTDWHDTLALGWAIHLQRWSIILLLLENGANPYLNFDPSNIIIDQFFKVNKSRKKRKVVLFREFFEKFNELCLKASPSTESAWTDRSISERVVMTLKKL